jgi:nickel-dependent lactate racemase
MKINLAYGRTGLEIVVPDDAQVLSPVFVSGLIDEADAIRNALRHPIGSLPLAQKVKPGDRVVITHSDITRATPNERILPVLLEELEENGIRCEQITLLNALGTHRPQTEEELRNMLGDEIVKHYRCMQHDAFDDANLIHIGTTASGHPVRVNRLLVESDVRIYTGFIEPHFFAGFSGGPKSVLPALAGAESVLSNHGSQMIAHPKSTWGVTMGNPIWEEMREAALLTKPTFLVNVALNRNKQITSVFAGDLLLAHATGCEFVRKHAMITVEAPYDMVITTNSGYPLDQNLYQSVKGLSAANRIVRPGGAILIATACEDGLPAHGRYAQLLQEAGSPQRVLEMVNQPDFSQADQWQVQIQAMIQQKADVFIYSQGLTEIEIRQALFNPVANIQDFLAELLQRYGSRLCVLPEGPLTVPSVDELVSDGSLS